MNTNKKKYLSIFCCKSWSATWQDVEMLLREGSAILNEYCFIKFISDIDVHTALVSFKKYMPPPIPYFKVNICPFPLPHFTLIFSHFWFFSLTQLYRYTPEIFLFTTATFKYTYRAPVRRIGQEYSANVACFIFKSLKRIQPLPVFAEFFICIRNSLDRPCVTMPHDHLLSNVK